MTPILFRDIFTLLKYHFLYVNDTGIQHITAVHNTSFVWSNVKSLNPQFDCMIPGQYTLIQIRNTVSGGGGIIMLGGLKINLIKNI